jgi:hypothetical protein
VDAVIEVVWLESVKVMWFIIEGRGSMFLYRMKA